MLGLWGRGGFKAYWKETIELYDDLIFTSLSKNSSHESRRLPRDPDKIGVDFMASYDGDNVTFYYLIQAMPKTLSLNFKNRMRKECKHGVRVNFFNYLRGHTIEWDSPQMRSRLKVLEEVGNEQGQEKVNVYNLHDKLSNIKRQTWIEKSLEYLAVADRDRERALLKSSMMVTISGKRGEAFDDSIEAVESYTRNAGIKLHRVLYDIPDLIRYFIPFSRKNNKDVAKLIPTQVLPDEIVARYSTYSQGKLGKYGIYFGTDTESGFPVMKKVKASDESAENWLITGETGSGKSALIKAILLEMLALGYRGTVMDIEGFEYIPHANLISHKGVSKVINFSEGKGRYFDPVEIAEPTGLTDIDTDRKKIAIDFSLANFRALCGKIYEEDTWVDTVLNDAVSEVYRLAGVTEDPETWSKYSKGKRLHDIYAQLFVLRDEKYRDDVSYLSAVEKVIANTGKYFEPTGTRASVYSERISIAEIIDADLLICSFGMAGKSPESIDPIQMNLMEIGAAQISYQRSIYSKAQGKFNFKLWEEFQRWGEFPGSEKTIGVALTGGRKVGDINIIVTNQVGSILTHDRFGLMGNITSFLVGAISDSKVRADLMTRLSIPHMLPDLDRISKEAKLEDDDRPPSKYTFAFLCGLDRSKYSTVKMDIPKDLLTTKLFKTGIDRAK